MSAFDTIAAATWPAHLAAFGASVTVSPLIGADYLAQLIWDESEPTVGRKGGKAAGAIRGPKTSFTVAPAHGDTYTLDDGRVLKCIEIDEDRPDGWLCWCRLQSAT